MRLLPCLTGLLFVTTVAMAQPGPDNGPGPNQAPGYDPSQQAAPGQGPGPGPGYDPGQGQGEVQGPGSGGPGFQNGGQGAPMRPHVSFKQKFEAANVTHDGRLTVDQARQGRMGMVAHNFEQIDADHKGYVTVQDIRSWQRARHHAQAAQQQPPTQ